MSLAAANCLVVALNEPLVEIVNPNDLMLGVNAPVMDIPKVGVASPHKSLPKVQ